MKGDYPRKVKMLVEYTVEFETLDDEAETVLGDILNNIHYQDHPDGPYPSDVIQWSGDGWHISEFQLHPEWLSEFINFWEQFFTGHDPDDHIDAHEMLETIEEMFNALKRGEQWNQ